MRECKRVLLAPKLWGLLALLLAVNLFLLITQDGHVSGFYAEYQTALPHFTALDPEQAETEIEQELSDLQKLGLLNAFLNEEDEQFRELLREDCVEELGEDFEARLSEYDLSEDAMQETYRRGAVLEALSAQLAYIRSYPAYLRQVQANVKQMKALAIFSTEGSFSQRNIEKTSRDFPAEVALQMDNDFAVTMLVTDQVGGYTLLIFTLFLTLQFLDERKRGLWSLVHGTPEGRGRLACRRAGILLGGITLGTLVLLGGKLLFGAVAYGGLGSLTRNVQSLAVFSDFPWVMPVWTALLGYYTLRILGMWLVGMAVWAILQAVNHLPLALAAAGAVIAVEFTLFRFIPDSYAIVILRYVNLFAMVNVTELMLHYLNLNLFGVPVQGFLLSLGLVVPMLPVLFAGNLLLAQRKKPISRQNALLVFLDRLRVPFSKAVGRLRLLGMELYKLLWLQKGVLVLLLLAVYVFGVMDAPYPDVALYDTTLSGLSASMEGPITEDTVRALDEKISEYSDWDPTGPIVQQLLILNRLRVKAKNSLAAQDGLWFINPVPFAALMGADYRYQRTNAIVLLLALVLLLSGVFSQERQSRTTQLLQGTPRGRGALLRKKTAAAVLLTVAVWLIFEAGELCLIYKAYGSPAFSAPIQSLDAFSDLQFAVCLGTGVLVYMLLRLLAMLAATGVIVLLSRLNRQTNAAILLGCAVLVLPACLCYMFYQRFDYLSFSLLLSPMEASTEAYVCISAAACIMYILQFLVLFKKGRLFKRGCPS